MSNYAILRTEKLNNFGSIGGSLSHTFRTRPTSNANPDVKNKHLFGPKTKKFTDLKIRKRLSEISGSDRKNGVKCIELLLTFSPEMAGKIKLKDWSEANCDFLIKKFGKENLINATLHLDETTPHIVAYVIPEVDGRMNCRSILGGREKMRKLQTDYAASMSRFGLERGIEGSKAKHQTIKRYYADTNKTEEQTEKSLKEFSKIPEPPKRKLFQTIETYEEAFNEWKEKTERQYGNIVNLLEKNHHLNQYNGTRINTMEQKIENLENEKRVAEETVQTLTDNQLTKEQISQLRKLDISLVASRMGFFDEIKKGENPIDLLIRVNGFSYKEATWWLFEEFGALAVGSAVSEFVNVKKPEKPLTVADKVIQKEIRKQTDALGCDKYRISIIPENGKPYIPGKPAGKKSEEEFYSKKDLENMVPYLRTQNNQDKNIIITPMDDHCFYILLDDSKKTLDELKQQGFTPCLYQKTSWESSQAVFKIPKEGFDRKKQVLPYFNEINRKWGDDEITGLRHGFRLAGFRNMKQKHIREGQRPFVKLVECVNQFCQKTMYLIRQKYPDPTLKVQRDQDLLSVPKA